MGEGQAEGRTEGDCRRREGRRRSRRDKWQLVRGTEKRVEPNVSGNASKEGGKVLARSD